MDFVILIALISVFPNVYRAELPLQSCSTEKPFRMDSSICSSFKEVCIKTDSSQCRTLLNACSQCPPSEYTVSMLATLNMQINELSNLTKKNLSDLSNLTKKDISDLSSMLMMNISDLSNLTKKNLSDLSRMTKDISEQFNIKKEINDTLVSAMKGMETKLSNHHSWLVGLLFGELIIIVIMIIIIIIITLKNHRRLRKCCKTSKPQDPTTKVEIPLMQAAPNENMNTISSEFGAMLKAQVEAIEAKLLTDSQKAQEDLAELNSKVDEIKKSLVEKVDGTEAGLISTLNKMSKLLMEREKTNDDNLNSRLDIINKFLVEKLDLRIAATEAGELPETIEGARGGTDEDILLGGTGEPKE